MNKKIRLFFIMSCISCISISQAMDEREASLEALQKRVGEVNRANGYTTEDYSAFYESFKSKPFCRIVEARERTSIEIDGAVICTKQQPPRLMLQVLKEHTIQRTSSKNAFPFSMLASHIGPKALLLLDAVANEDQHTLRYLDGTEGKYDTAVADFGNHHFTRTKAKSACLYRQYKQLQEAQEIE